ncbi:hypothetical protein [Paludisphaera mucosa]|uniref:Uncharacterized protein n=1 Tax=Paludisphaera mucosa TaxID=3030827 RepID=A0ABT6FAY8_9BACT|nr:hypothetical protein [Paludisphaera mucosa]MDG3004661.1 hypothetical protein [Paludisphaera mucosa]
MRSIYSKILAWAAATVALSSIGFVATFWYLSESRSAETRFFHGIIRLQRDGAARAFRDGGPEGLRAYLAEMGASFEGEHFLVDARGRDLVDGRDRGDVLARGRGPHGGGDSPGRRPPPSAAGPPCSSAPPRPTACGSWRCPACGSPGSRPCRTTPGSCCSSWP